MLWAPLIKPNTIILNLIYQYFSMWLKNLTPSQCMDYTYINLIIKSMSQYLSLLTEKNFSIIYMTLICKNHGWKWNLFLACLVYIKTGNLQVDYTGLNSLQHVLGLVVLHKVLHDAGRNGAELVTEDVGLKALQERPPGNVVHREPVIDPPKQDVSEIMECTLVNYVCQCSFLLFIPFREYSLNIVSAHVFSSL